MKVVNLRKKSYTIYIGRGSIFGNPFRIGRDGNREDVIKKYEKNIRIQLFGEIAPNEIFKFGRKKLRESIYNLPKNAILGCFCAPLQCHGDIIIKIWKELHQ